MARPGPESRQSAVAHWGFYGYAVVTAALGLGHFSSASSGLGPTLETIIILSLAATLVYSGVDARDGSVSPSGVVRALGLTAVSGAAFAALAVAIALIWQLEGHPVVDTAFIVSFATGLGLAVGAQASLYAVAVAEERSRLADLVKLLTMNERVLRHNLRNDLAIVVGHLDNLAAGSDTEAVAAAKRHVDAVLDTSDRTRRIFDLWQTDVATEQSVAAAVETGVRRFREEYPDGNVMVHGAVDATVLAHPELSDAFYETLRNAAEHNEPGVNVEVTLSRPCPSEVVVEVADDGCGIPEAERRAFDQSTETPLEHGSGLGLWLVYWLVRSSDGRLEFVDRDPEGTVVRLALPTIPDETGVAGRFTAAYARLAAWTRRRFGD